MSIVFCRPWLVEYGKNGRSVDCLGDSPKDARRLEVGEGATDYEVAEVAEL